MLYDKDTLFLEALILDTNTRFDPTPEDFPNPGIKLRSPTSQVDSLPSEPPGKSY